MSGRSYSIANHRTSYRPNGAGNGKGGHVGQSLGDLARGLGALGLEGDPSVRIQDVVYDSRQAHEGCIFAAVQGLAADGRRFISAAVASGAVAVLTDQALEQDPGVPVLMVENAREAMAQAAALVFGEPARRMTLVGVTGTNGKTTTTYLLESILKAAGAEPGIIGTVNARYRGRQWPAPNTTPEGPDLQRILYQMASADVTHAVMEVSSHALSLGRVAGCRFDAAVFTNLTQDHLDFHQNFEAYYQAKKTLFTRRLGGGRMGGAGRAVLNADDPWGRRLMDELGPGILSYGLDGPADVYVVKRKMTRTGFEARIQTPAGAIDIRTALLGDINVYNTLAAVAAASVLGLPLVVIEAGLAGAAGAPGRLERVGRQDDFLVLVDYAHSPDALARALSVARGLEPHRLISIFGCGGDRDRTKRPLMARAAGELSDLAILTSDNPRTEDPLSIIGMAEPGLVQIGGKRVDIQDLTPEFEPGSYAVQPDRREAIGLAVRLMKPGDIVVVTGKGHEDYQVLGTTKIHFDDREEAAAALKRENRF